MRRVLDIVFRELDKLWEYKIKERAGFKCEISGSREGGLDAAHIIGRDYLWTRWDLRNGMAVSRANHDHKTIMEWLKRADRRRYNWIMKQKRTVRHGQKPDLKKVRRKLEAA